MNYTPGAVKFYGYDGQFWSEAPGDFPYQTIDLSSKELILKDLDDLYTTALGKSLINKALNADSLRFVGLALANTDNGPAFGLNATGTPNHTVESVQINYSRMEDVYWFNPSGTLVKGDAALAIAHELAHIVYEQDDPRSFRNETPESFDTRQNASGFDFQGPQVRAQNVIARQLSLPDQVRVSYGGAAYGEADVAKFKLGESYTDGAIVDIVRRGGDGVNTMDHSARTDASRDLMFGEGGGDYIDGGGGSDWLYGGDGDDTIHGGTGRDTIWGDDQFDQNVTGNDTMYGEDGSDTIHGGNGVDYIYGGAGGDILNGDNDEDHLFGDAGSDHLIGGSGEDTLLGGAGIDLLEGGWDIDTLRGEAGNDLLFGQGGDDVLIGGGGTDQLLGGDGADVLRGGAAADMLYGGAGEDQLEGEGGDDLIFGGDAKDILSGGVGSDTVYGQAGDDLIQGDGGADKLYGEAGDDSIVAGTGNDTLFSGSGNNNGLFGEAGADTLIFDNGGGGVVDGGAGNDLIDARAGNGGVRMFWAAGGGLDRLAASYDFDVNTLTPTNYDGILGASRSARGVAVIEFQGKSINDFKLVWAASVISSETIEGNTYFLYGGNLRVVDKATGALGVDLGFVIGASPYFAPTFAPTYLQFLDIPQLVFDDGRFEDSPEGGDNMELVITAGTSAGASGGPVPQPASGDASLVAAFDQVAANLIPFGAELALLI